LGLFWSYHLNSTANSAYSPRKWAKWAELVVLFSWQLQNGPQDFDFFQLLWVPIILLSFFSIETPTYAPQFIGHNNFFLGSVGRINRSSYTMLVSSLEFNSDYSEDTPKNRIYFKSAYLELHIVIG
jgi:hypothetical protein